MRKAMDRQQRLDRQPILDVQLNPNCRDEMIPILTALQHIHAQPKLREDILRAIAKDVNRDSSHKLGRQGLDYWSILVLAAVRLGCNLNYDRLQNLAEQHHALRQMMGIGNWDEGARFDWRRIRDNITLVRPETIERINHLIVAEGHQLIPQAARTARADSFVVETDVHYPTESSLIRDGLRKILRCGVAISDRLDLDGWRQHKHLYRKAKALSRQIDRVAARKGAGYQQRLQSLYRELLALAQTLMIRAEELRANLRYAAQADAEVLGRDAELGAFLERTRHVCGTAQRRVLQGQNVPNSEKLFSVFETHTQLYKRGKAAEPVQFGRQVLVYEDGAGFIAHAYLLPRDLDDHDVVVKQTRVLQERLGGCLRRASFDRGFHSPENQCDLAEIIPHLCLPMPGAKQAVQQEQEATVEFRQARQRHPGIESAINALQAGNGLKRCRDRTEYGFGRYIQLGVLGRNLQVLGKILLAKQDAQCKAALSQRKKSAA
jgi:IS5 family transposase